LSLLFSASVSASPCLRGQSALLRGLGAKLGCKSFRPKNPSRARRHEALFFRGSVVARRLLLVRLDPLQIQSLRRRGGAGGATVLSFEHLPHLLGAEAAQAHLDQGADD